MHGRGREYGNDRDSHAGLRQIWIERYPKMPCVPYGEMKFLREHKRLVRMCDRGFIFTYEPRGNPYGSVFGFRRFFARLHYLPVEKRLPYLPASRLHFFFATQHAALCLLHVIPPQVPHTPTARRLLHGSTPDGRTSRGLAIPTESDCDYFTITSRTPQIGCIRACPYMFAQQARHVKFTAQGRPKAVMREH